MATDALYGYTDMVTNFGAPLGAWRGTFFMAKHFFASVVGHVFEER